MNDVIYMFQVQAVLESGGFGCWSEPTPAAPGKLGEVVERIEKHQEAIVEHTSTIVGGIAANREILRDIAASATTIAAESASISAGVRDVAKKVDVAGEKVACGLAGIAAQLSGTRGGCRDGKDGVDGKDGMDGKDGVDGKCIDCAKCPEPAVLPNPMPPCDGTPLGQLYESESYRLGAGNENAVTVKNVVEDLLRREGGLVLTQGYATSPGFAMYNLQLSDMRAACLRHYACARVFKAMGDSRSERSPMARR